MSLRLLCSEFLLLHVCVTCTSLSAALGWPCVKCAGHQHVGRFRQQSLAPPHPAQRPPQQEQLRGQPEQCQGNGLICQARFIAPPCSAPASHCFPGFGLKSFFSRKLVIKRGPRADTPSKQLLLMSGKCLGLWWRNQLSKIWHHGGGVSLGLWLCCCAAHHCLANTVKSAEQLGRACKTSPHVCCVYVASEHSQLHNTLCIIHYNNN